LAERYERPHIVGVSKIAYVLATPRRLDWRRGPQHPNANDGGARTGRVIALAREPGAFGPDGWAATLHAGPFDGGAMLAIVQELGAVAGLASVVGLVVLSALYVSHARDVKRLRDWAGDAPEGLGPGFAVPGRTTGVPRAGQPQAAAGASGAHASPAAVQEDAPAPVRRSRPRRRRTGPGRAPVLAGLLAVGLVTYAVSEMIGGDGGDHSGTTRATDNGPSREPRRPVVVKPGSVTVAVLNGTTINGLAASLRDQVAAAGYRSGTIDVFSDQQLGESVVEYAPGHLAAAKAVGRVLAISRYGPATADSRARAGDATVIVVAGADKAAAAPAAP
jgi:hypothetical protein